MKVSVEKLIILICIIFFGYGLVSMVISITIDFSYMFFIFGVITRAPAVSRKTQALSDLFLKVCKSICLCFWKKSTCLEDMSIE